MLLCWAFDLAKDSNIGEGEMAWTPGGAGRACLLMEFDDATNSGFAAEEEIWSQSTKGPQQGQTDRKPLFCWN
jgi:hypothetical protein